MTIDLDLELDIRGGGGGVVLRAGTGGVPVSFTGGTQHIDRNLSVNTTGSALFDNTVDLADFDFLYILPQADVLAEFNIGATPNKATFKIPAGVPFILGSDDATDDFDNALETVVSINIKAVTGTASVRLIAVT